MAVLALVVECGDGEQSTQTDIPPEARVAAPQEQLWPKDGGANLPDPAFEAYKVCDRKLRSGEYRSLAVSMDRIAGQTEPETVAVCRLCGGVAKINLGRTREGLKDLGEAEDLQGYLPRSVRPQMLTLLFSGQVIGYAAEGNSDGVRTALDKLAKVDPKRAEQYASKCAIVRPEGSEVSCEAPEREERPRSPERSPAGTEAPPPSPTDTGPDTTSPGPEPTGEVSPPEQTDTGPPPDEPPPGDEQPGDHPVEPDRT
ncbi:hypothetical protein AB0K60_03695 [Thermopolyspora sp. NPDC052614]|uniref:hypothetical protein n=1 Tax=Thermopolyspora sp. NPDC052614 TaxID=3155682 RepID=UPI0034325DD3